MWSTTVRPAPALDSTGRREFDVPDAAEFALAIDEIDEAAAEAAHRRNLEFAWADRLAERLVVHELRAIERRGRIIDLEADGADPRAMGDVEGMRKTFLLGVDHDVDRALRPSRHRLRLVHTCARKAEPAQELLERRRLALVDRELDKLGAEDFWARWQRRNPRHGDAGALAQLVEQEQQRALAVDGDALGRAGAELVVEDFERQQVVEVGRLQRHHEIDERQFTLSGKVAEVPAQREQIHVEDRRIGDLHQEDAVARDRADRRQVGLAGEDVEGVEHEADRGMRGAAHRLPGIAVIVDVTAPR